jgi:hypothetical protein
MRLQERKCASCVRRSLAATVAFWLVLAGMLGMWHEAHVAHVVDPHTGEVRHAERLVGHTSTDSDYHGAADRDTDDDVCAISTALHQAARSDTAPRSARAPRVELRSPSARTLDVAIAAANVYRLAPKTSPPRA